MKRKLMFFMTFLFVGIGLVTAQTSRVTGVVIAEEDGLPVVGASVLVNGTTLGTITDIDGKFTITNVPSSSKTYLIPSVVLSFVPIIVVAQRCSSSLPSFPFSFFSSSFMRNNLSLPKFISITTFLGESIW